MLLDPLTGRNIEQTPHILHQPHLFQHPGIEEQSHQVREARQDPQQHGFVRPTFDHQISYHKKYPYKG